MRPLGRRPARGARGALALAGLHALALSVACTPDGERGAYALYRHLELADELVIGAAPGWARRTAERLAPCLEAELGRRVVVREPAGARAGARRVRLLIGELDQPELQPVLERLGIAWGDGQVIRGALEGLFGGQALGALVATLPDPERRDAPLTVFVDLREGDDRGNAQADLSVARELRPTWRTGWQVWDSTGLLLAQGELEADGRARPHDRLRLAEPPPAVPALERIARDPELASLRADLEVARERIVELLGGSPRLEGFEPWLRVHAHPEDLARLARRWVSYRAAPASGGVDLVVREGLPVEARAAFAELFARRGAGEPAEPWLVQGVARHVANSWWGRDLGEWCAHLEQAGLVPPLEELISPAPGASIHQVAPLRGLLVGVLVESRGTEELRRLWRTGGLVPDGALRQAFVGRLRELVVEHAGAREVRRAARRAWVLSRSFRRGLVLVPARQRDDPRVAGPGSRAGAASLARAADLGADAVSIEVAAYLRRPWGRRPLEAREARRAQVSDVELASASADARRLGLDVTLSPDLWLSPRSTYAGQALVSTSGEWRLFFEEYDRFLVHYALLAELAGAEILSLGSELTASSWSVTSPGSAAEVRSQTEWRLARWRRLAGRARAAFSGALTYAASWEGETERIGFWDELDFCGVDLFVPLAAPRHAGAGAPPDFKELRVRLRNVLERAAARAAERGKPLLLTEIGFPSTRDAWTFPGRPRGPADESAQTVFFAALASLNLTAAGGIDNLAGMYVWCWSADPEAGGPTDRGYSPQGKRSERALERALRVP